MEKLEEKVDQRVENRKSNYVPLPPSTSGFRHSSSVGIDVSSLLKKRKGAENNPITKAYNKEMRSQLDHLIGRMFYTGGVSFNLARNPYFMEAFAFAARNHLPGYVAPGYNNIRTTLLDEERVHVERLIEPIKKTWRSKGVSIVSDGWSDVQRRPLINFIAICDTGPMFLKAIDTSGETKDKHFIANLLKEVIDEVGDQNVVQVITDNAKNCKGAGEIIEGIYPLIYWTPCVVHTLNLALKNICAAKNVENNAEIYDDLHWITEIHGDALQIKNFIMNHGMILAIFNKFSSLKLLAVADTRFASIVVMLKRIRLLRYTLQAMVISEEWLSYRDDGAGKARFVKEKILDELWWDKVDYILDSHNQSTI